MPKSYDEMIENMIEDMDIKQMIEKANESMNNMNRESERAEKTCMRIFEVLEFLICLLYTSPSPRDS